MMEWILTSSVLILVVIVLRAVLKGKISLRLQYALWALVLVRLLLPFSLFDSPFSVMSAVEHAAPALEETENVVVGYRDYVTPDLSVVEPDPNAPLEEQEKQYEQNLADWKAEMEEAKAETGTPVTVADIVKMLKTVWLAGTAAVALWFVIVNLRFGGKLKQDRTAVSVEEYPLPVYRCAQVETPCLYGLLRPAVYLTDEVTEGEALRHVLAHELTHSRHGDHIWSVLRCLCLALHWYNPLVWLAASLSRRDAELACDEGTLKRIGEEQRTAYGRTLIGLTCTRRGAAALSLTATTMTGSKRGIAERILLIAKKPQMKKWTLAVLLVLIVVAAGCTFSGAGKDESSGPKEEGKVWDVTLTLPEEQGFVETFDEPDLETSSGELCFQNRNLFAVHLWLADDDGVVAEGDIQPGGQWVFKQAVPGTVYEIAVFAEVEAGTEIHLVIYDGNAEQEPYELPQPAEPMEPNGEVVYSWADWSDEDIARWESEIQWEGLSIRTNATDYEEIGHAFAEAFVAQFLNTSEEHPARCTDVAVVNCDFGNESLTSHPKELIFGIYFARKPVNEQELITWTHGWAEPMEERLYPEYGEGWYGDGRFFTLEQAADGSWVCTGAGTGGYGGWGYLNYGFEGAFDIYFQDFLDGGDALAEVMLEALFLVDWDSFDARWGAEGREALRTVLDTVCLTEGRIYGPEETRMWSDVYSNDQLYRNLYMMYSALSAGEEFTDVFKAALKKQQAYDPAAFGEALAQLSAENRAFVEKMVQENTKLVPATAVYELFDAAGDMTLTLYLANEGRYNAYAVPSRWYAERFEVLVSGYRWVEMENPEITQSEYWLTAESSDGKHKMTFWSGESNVAYHDGGMIQYEDGSTTTYWIGAPLNAGLVSIARDIRREYDNLDVSFSRIMFYQEGDAEKAANSFVHSAYGSHRISSLAPGNWYRFTEYEVIDWAVREVSEDGTAVVGWFNYAFIPENMEAPGIWAGNTEHGTGEYEGMLTEYREFVLQKQEDGYWHCVGFGTGGYSLDRY